MLSNILFASMDTIRAEVRGRSGEVVDAREVTGCTHEASHCVAALATGRRVTYVTWTGAGANPGACQLLAWEQPPTDPAGARSWTEREAAIVLAPDIGENWFMPTIVGVAYARMATRGRGGDDDILSALYDVWVVTGGGTASYDAWVTARRAEARRVLVPLKDEVGLVAMTLLGMPRHARRLDTDDLTRLLPHLAVRPTPAPPAADRARRAPHTSAPTGRWPVRTHPHMRGLEVSAAVPFAPRSHLAKGR